MNRILRSLIWLIGLALLFSVSYAMWVNRRFSHPCRGEVVLSPQDYWMLQKTDQLAKVHEEGGFVKARMVDDPESCIVISRQATEDVTGRTEGYKTAVMVLLNKAYSSSFNSVQSRLRQLTGQDFASTMDVERWVLANFEHLTWSRERDMLVVDEYVMRVKPWNAPLRAGDELAPQEYWYLYAERRLREPRVEGQYRIVKAQKQDMNWVEVRALEGKLADAEAKREGYLRALDDLLRRLYDAAGDDAAERDAAFLLGELTGEHLPEIAQWREWRRHHDGNNLVLSGDGERIVRRQE